MRNVGLGFALRQHRQYIRCCCDEVRSRVRNCVTSMGISSPCDILNRISLAAVVAAVSLFGGCFGCLVLVCWSFCLWRRFRCWGVVFSFSFFLNLVLGIVVRAPTPNWALN